MEEEGVYTQFRVEKAAFLRAILAFFYRTCFNSFVLTSSNSSRGEK